MLIDCVSSHLLSNSGCYLPVTKLWVGGRGETVLEQEVKSGVVKYFLICFKYEIIFSNAYMKRLFIDNKH